MFSTQGGSGFHPVMIDKHDTDRHHTSHSMLIAVIFVIFIIFALVIFMAMFRRGDHKIGAGVEALAPVIAAKAMDGHHKGYDYGWDNHRDMSRYFYDQRQITDRYFYEQQKEMLLGFKNSEILGLQNTASVKDEVRGLRDEIKEDKLREQGNKINYLESLIGIRGLNAHYCAPYSAPNPTYA